MKHFAKLFRLLEITRSHPQYGYSLAEIPKAEISDLAQHHYLVTFIAWQLVRMIKRAGGSVNGEKVLEFSLIHDLGELFGGDIAMPYAQANPAARKAAKAFERENQKFMANFFGEDKQYFDELSEEILSAHSDEALIAKVADYIECSHYKLYVRKLSPGDLVMTKTKLDQIISKIADSKTKTCLEEFVEKWIQSMSADDATELFEAAKQGKE